MKKVLCGLFLVHAFGAQAMEKDLEWGLSDRQGRRKTMEDAYVLKTIFVRGDRYTVFGLFDGHGGAGASRDAAQYIENSLQADIDEAQKESLEGDGVLKKALQIASAKLDQHLQATYENEGTTMLLAIVGNNNVHFVWIGDSRGIVINEESMVKATTVDHKPDAPEELKRIGGEKVVYTNLIQDSNGSQALMSRSFNSPCMLKPGQKLLRKGPARLGDLAVSRALGDRRCKENEPLIMAIPEIMSVPVVEGDYLILACDGLWDVMSHDAVKTFVIERLLWPIEELKDRYYELKPSLMESGIEEAGSSERMLLIARALRNKAYDLKSTDNISVILIKI